MNRLDYSQLNHPVLQRMPRNDAEWIEFVRIILDTAGNIVSKMLDNGQLSDASALPMVLTGNKSSVQIGAGPNLTGIDAGSDAKITIDAHSVRFDFGDVAYNSGEITGLAYSTTYFVYADDPDYQGGAVSYFADTAFDVLTDDRGRYFVGEVDTPAAAAPPTSGGGGGGAGGGGSGGGYQWP